MVKAIGFMANLAGTFMPSDLVIDEGIPDRVIPETWVTIVAGAGGKLRNAGAIIRTWPSGTITEPKLEPAG
ncbi:hypothetical protein ColLi_02680 [Colletotrichum liriopes]|uniref:Uncharacterized protein n=1 Tax=Colletotrichum liriopes TaxID=708192 RepID=A0AA37LPZ0_9PEZI|nr:hypothetical protein ColLi_02680 [Colletotrichum liriopes]